MDKGFDFFDTYAPLARITTIRMILALASIHKLLIYQMDVKTIFLHGDLEEEIYVKQPEGFIVPDQENKACKLVKSLNRLKQAPKQWHENFDSVILSYGFQISESDNCLYHKLVKNKYVILCLYVDDILILAHELETINEIKEFLFKKFDMKDLGEADEILGMKIIRTPNSIKLSQSHYTRMVLEIWLFQLYTGVNPL